MSVNDRGYSSREGMVREDFHPKCRVPEQTLESLPYSITRIITFSLLQKQQRGGCNFISTKYCLPREAIF